MQSTQPLTLSSNMNKTITINIAGIVFHIDETAYEQLRQYLASIKRHFETSEGRDEIIADIESRRKISSR
jgi:hypothetical protein